MARKDMTPGEAFTSIVVTFGIDGCDERDIHPDVRAHVPALAQRGFLYREGRDVKPGMDKLADVITAGARAIIDNHPLVSVDALPRCSGGILEDVNLPTCRVGARQPATFRSGETFFCDAHHAAGWGEDELPYAAEIRRGHAR